MTNPRDEQRGGLSPLIVVGAILWTLVFAGLLSLRYFRDTGKPTPDELRDQPGVVSEDDDPQDSDDEPNTIVVDLSKERREALETELANRRLRASELAAKDSAARSQLTEARKAILDGGAEAQPALEAAERAVADAKAALDRATADVDDAVSRLEALNNGWSPDGLPEFELIERSGEKVTRDDLLGKPCVVGFVFTRCPGPCPKVSLKMYELQQATKDLDLRLVTISVDPERDTPEVLRTYAENYGADSERWLFLTGTEDVIYPLIGGGFSMPVKKGDGENYDVVHTTNLMYVGANGVVRGKYNSLDADAFAELKRVLGREVPRVNGAASPSATESDGKDTTDTGADTTDAGQDAAGAAKDGTDADESAAENETSND